MSDRIDSLSAGMNDRRETARRQMDRPPEPQPDGGTNLPAVIAPQAPPLQPAPAAGPAAFAAQLIGQGGARRGLRGGPPVLGAARSAYLETEYSGPQNRRPPRGAVTKTDV